MDENEVQAVPEVSGDLNDVDVSDIDFNVSETDVESFGETEGEPKTEEAEADQPEQKSEEADKEDTKSEDATKATDQFTLKHLDEVKTVSKDEVVALAQKGMDYDRLKTKSEERYATLDGEHKQALAALDVFAKIAQKSNYKDVAELADATLAQMMVDNGEFSTAETALKQIRLDRREKELAEKEKQLNSAGDTKAKVDADAKAFIDKYPKVDLGTIPQEVWDRVNKGESLVTAYSEYTVDKTQKDAAAEIERLKTELEATKKNADNKSRSTGSVTSAGKDAIKDPWLADLEART